MRIARLPVGALVALSLIALPSVSVRTACAQSLTFARVGSIADPVDRIRADGQFLYIASGRTLTIFDISKPASPNRVGRHTFPEQIWGFRVDGTRAYVADGHAGLGILDLSNPSAPALVALVKMPGQAKNVAVAGTKALVANHMSGVDIVDLSNATKPALLGSAFVDGYARDVATSGTLGVAVDNPSGVYVFDLTNVTALDPVTTLQSATAPQQVEIVEIAGAQQTKVAVLAGSEPYDPLRAVRLQAGGQARPGSVQVFDVSNPTAPVLAATHPTSGGGRRLAVKGPLVYVADGPAGLRVLDLSTPSKPTVVGTYKTATPARDVAVADSLVFIAVGSKPDSGDVLILRQSP